MSCRDRQFGLMVRREARRLRWALRVSVPTLGCVSRCLAKKEGLLPTLAAVQLDFVPSAIDDASRNWVPSEPLAWAGGPVPQELSLGILSTSFPRIKALRMGITQDLIAYQEQKLKRVLTFLEQQGIDLCVFPEYSLIPSENTFKILSGFATSITIVAGIGVPRNEGVELLRRYTGDPVTAQNNAAVVFSENACHVVTKRGPAAGEAIVPGTGPRLLEVRVGQMECALAVAICKDYIDAGSSLIELERTPDFAAIPALSATSRPFAPYAPHDFPRLFANRAREGGTTIYASGLSGPLLDAAGTPLSLPAGSEGVVAISWNGPAEKPTPLRKPYNRVVLRSSLITRDDGTTVNEIVEALEGMATQAESTAGDAAALDRWNKFLTTRADNGPLKQSVELLQHAVMEATLTPDLLRTLTRHIGADELVRLEHVRARAYKKCAEELHTVVLATPPSNENYDVALRAASIYKPLESPVAPSGQTESIEGALKTYFSIGFGSFESERAIRTLASQADLLNVFAGAAPGGSRIVLSLRSAESVRTGNTLARVSMTFLGPDNEDSAGYFSGLERIARTVFASGWSLHGGDSEPTKGTIVRLVPGELEPRLRSDWGLLVDVLRGAEPPCAVDVILTVDRDAEPLRVEGSIAAPSTLDSATTFFYGSSQGPPVRLGVRVTSPAPSPALVATVSSVFYGDAGVAALPADGWEISPDDRAWPVNVAHRLFHPPHGHIDGRGVGGRADLWIPVPDVSLPETGAPLGTSQAARPFVDQSKSVRLPESSRTRHVYVIGKTGVGKTNTLKNIARHDIESQKPVIVIDAHGDLFDYCVLHSADREDLLALDLTKPDSISLNPIYLDARSKADIETNISELSEALAREGYHEWTGPRFAQIFRMVVWSLYILAGDESWASLVDVPRAIEDESFQKDIESRLRVLGERELANQWLQHRSMKREERAEVEQWFGSKFGAFRGSALFAQVTSGEPTVSLQEVLGRGGVVLVKVPMATIGRDVASFLGSLLVGRIVRYALDGTFSSCERHASLIVDEFQNFVGDGFVTLIPEARKFNLGLTLANQTLSQLTAFSRFQGVRDDSVRSVLLGNVGTIVVQGVRRADAEILAPDLAVRAEDLLRIGKHSALLSFTVEGEQWAAFTCDMMKAEGTAGGVASREAENRVGQKLEKLRDSLTPPARPEHPEVQEDSPMDTEEPTGLDVESIFSDGFDLSSAPGRGSVAEEAAEEIF